MVETKKLLDRRVVERYIEKGLVKDPDFQNYLKNLPDETNNAQFVQMDLHDAELSGDGHDHGDDEHEGDTTDETAEESAEDSSDEGA